MKRFLLSGLLLASACCSFSATKTWTGASGNNWSDAANWSPSGSPLTGDDVIIPASATIHIDFASTFLALNSIAVINYAVVVFDCGSTKNFRLSGTDALLPGLLVEAGAALTLDASGSGTNNSSFDLTYGGGVMGSIYGTLAFSNTGGSGSGVHIITDRTDMDYGILTVYAGGAIKIYPGAGNTSSSLLPVPTIVMKDGSVYENLKNGGSFPEGLWESNSLARALSPGTNGPVFNGTDYGNLEWNCPNQSFVAFLNKGVSFNHVSIVSTGSLSPTGEFRIKSGASSGVGALIVNGDLYIGADARLGLTSDNTPPGTANGAQLILKGNLRNEGTMITYAPSTRINELQLAGTSQQDIASTGTIAGDIHIILNNPAGVTLISPVTIPYHITFYNGKIRTTASTVLTFSEQSIYAGASSQSFVEGPVRKIGPVDFTFPIGYGGIYAPLTYNAISGNDPADVFTAEYVRGNPQSSVGNVYDFSSGVDHISFVEYWRLIQDNGSPVASVALTVNPESFCRNMSSTFVSRYDGATGWRNEGGVVMGTPSPLPGFYESGTIRTANDISGFGYFTLGTTDPFVDNPLPVKLLVFNASKLSLTAARLDWELADYASPAARFEIERSGENRQFLRIATVGGSTGSRFYTVQDNELQMGINYYRLKVTDAGGEVSYSRVVPVLNGHNELLLTMSPTIVQSQAFFSVNSSAPRLIEMFIVDLAGRTVKKLSRQVAGGQTDLSLPLDNLPGGIYLLYGVAANIKTNVIRFIKQ